MRRRAESGKRWSASSSTARFDASGARLADGQGTAVRVQVRWRLDGVQRKAVLRGPDCEQHAAALQALLLAAYVGDWPADASHRPVVPAPLPAPAPPPAGAATDAAPGEPTTLPGGRALPAPAAPGDTGSADVAALVAWRKQHHRSALKRRGGGKKRGTTVAGYDSELDFIARIAVHQPGDPRLAALGLEPGASLRLDDPATGLCEADLISLIDVRGTTNLRTRTMNESRMAKWAAAVRSEERRAAREHREPQLPAVPELVAEEASARTIQSFCRELKGLLTQAHQRGLIPYQPWTAVVDDHVVWAGPVNYTTKNVANRDQVRRLAEAMAAVELPALDRTGRMVPADGRRYAAMVELKGIEGPREEELTALRLSWLELDGPLPRLGLRHAEVFEPLDGGGRERIVVPLKHRQQGETRWVDLTDEPELVERLRCHVRDHVPRPVPGSDDPDERDPYVFTDHRGRPIDFANFGRWWKAARDAALVEPGDEAIRGLPFRQLRAAAITGWLVRGETLAWCAEQAGNSQSIIEKHYRGVNAEIGYHRTRRPRLVPDAPAPPPADPASRTPDELAKLPAEEVASLLEACSRDLARRATG